MSVIPISSPVNPLATGINPGDIFLIDQVDNTQITGFKTKRLTASTLLNPRVLQPSAAPASVGLWDSFADAFTGDNSQIAFGTKHAITGVATLTQPTSGYHYTPELTPHVNYFYNGSGWNNSTSGNGGRTAAVVHRTYLYQAGQGDCVAYNATAFIASTRASATSFLACPAATFVNGDMSAGVAGAYLNPGEFALSDNVTGTSYDIAAVGWVVRLNRNTDVGTTGAGSSTLGNVWYGYRVISEGTLPADSMFCGVGKFKIGIDLTGITTNASGTWTTAAIVLKSQDRIYFNGSATASPGFAAGTGSDYIQYSSGSGGLVFVSGGNASLQVTSAQVSMLAPLVNTNPITACSTVTIPAGGTAGQGIKLSSTSNFGIFFGSGTPSLAAAKGSLYLRSDGAINARLYINTDGSTTWTAFNTTS